MDMLVKGVNEYERLVYISFGTFLLCRILFFYTCNLWKYMIILRSGVLDIKEEGS